MSRKKTEINPLRAERVKKIIELEKISQKDFADRTFFRHSKTSPGSSNNTSVSQKKRLRILLRLFPNIGLNGFLDMTTI